MADFGGILLCSTPFHIQVGSGAASNHTLDASNDLLEFIFQAPEAATITDLGYLYGARTGTPPTYVIQLEGVNLSTGRADGTVKGATNNAKKTFTPPASTADDGVWKWPGAMTETYTCTRGEFLAIVIKYSSGTVNGSNCSSFGYSFGAMPSQNLPYANTDNAGVNTKQALVPIYGYKSASKTYGFPFQNFYQTSFSSDSTPDEMALRFVVPTSVCSTYTVGYVDFYGRPPDASKSIKVILYSGTTALQDVTVDSDALATNSSKGAFRVYFDESSLSTLSAGSTYRISIQPQETANNVQLAHYEVSTNSDFQAWPGGAEWYFSSRTDSGAWTDTTTKRPQMALGITDMTSGAAGGLLKGGNMGGV